MIAVKREKICSATGMTRMPSEIASTQDSSSLYQWVSRRQTWRGPAGLSTMSGLLPSRSERKRPQEVASCGRALPGALAPELHRVDLLVDLGDADLLGVVGHDRVDPRLHLL